MSSISPINTARQVGGSLGVAIYGALLAGHDFRDGLRLGLGTTAVVLLILITASLPLRHAKSAGDTVHTRL
jgi:MFS transporter, DHA2 family, methylenomycin A resistance protein